MAAISSAMSASITFQTRAITSAKPKPSHRRRDRTVIDNRWRVNGRAVGDGKSMRVSMMRLTTVVMALCAKRFEMFDLCSDDHGGRAIRQAFEKLGSPFTKAESASR